MEPSEGFAVFVAAAEAGSVSGAARTLGMPRATVSRQLSRLERRLEVRLVHRDTHRFHLTEAGQLLFVHAQRVVRESEEALAALKARDDTPSGLLRVSLPYLQTESMLDGLLLDFAAQWPRVQLEAHMSAAHVDLHRDRFDVALRGGQSEDPTLISKTLFRVQRIAIATPDYLAAHGTPQTPEDLAHHKLILGFRHGAEPVAHWPLLDGGEVPVRGVLSSSDVRLQTLAAKRGMGISLGVASAHAADLAAGRLVHVLPDHVGLSVPVCLVYPARDFRLPKVRAFADHVTSWFEAQKAAFAARAATDPPSS